MGVEKRADGSVARIAVVLKVGVEASLIRSLDVS